MGEFNSHSSIGGLITVKFNGDAPIPVPILQCRVYAGNLLLP